MLSFGEKYHKEAAEREERRLAALKNGVDLDAAKRDLQTTDDSEVGEIEWGWDKLERDCKELGIDPFTVDLYRDHMRKKWLRFPGMISDMPWHKLGPNEPPPLSPQQLAQFRELCESYDKWKNTDIGRKRFERLVKFYASRDSNGAIDIATPMNRDKT